MRIRPASRGRWLAVSALVVAAAVSAGCLPQQGADSAKDEEPEPAASPGQRDATQEAQPQEPEQEPGESDGEHSELTDSEQGWEDGALESTSSSGVTFQVPADWERFPDSAIQESEEVVYLWRDGTRVFAEAVVVNVGEDGDPESGVESYREVLQSGSTSVDSVGDPEPVTVDGADDALRMRYTYSGDGPTHGTVVAFTAATGDVILFVLTADGDNASEALMEEILATVHVGTPPDGGV